MATSICSRASSSVQIIPTSWPQVSGSYRKKERGLLQNNTSIHLLLRHGVHHQSSRSSADHNQAAFNNGTMAEE
jgi:hypothetical protein